MIYAPSLLLGQIEQLRIILVNWMDQQTKADGQDYQKTLIFPLELYIGEKPFQKALCTRSDNFMIDQLEEVCCSNGFLLYFADLEQTESSIRTDDYGNGWQNESDEEDEYSDPDVTYRMSLFSSLDGADPFVGLDLSFGDLDLTFVMEEDFEEAEPDGEEYYGELKTLTYSRTVGILHICCFLNADIMQAAIVIPRADRFVFFFGNEDDERRDDNIKSLLTEFCESHALYKDDNLENGHLQTDIRRLCEMVVEGTSWAKPESSHF